MKVTAAGAGKFTYVPASLIENVRELAEDCGLALVVVFGSTARGWPRPRDLDLAVLPQDGWLSDAPADLPAFWQRCAQKLGRGDLDLVRLPTADWLLTQQVARYGHPLFEARPGLFSAFQRAAELRSADSSLWRRREQAFLRESLKGTLAMNRDLVRRKANQLKRSLDLLTLAMTRSLEDLEQDPLALHGCERLLELIIEDACTINAEVAQALAHIPPSDYYSSFFSMARTGWISSELANQLAPLTRVRNVLVHHYEDMQASVLYTALKDSLAAWTAYLRELEQRL